MQYYEQLPNLTVKGAAMINILPSLSHFGTLPPSLAPVEGVDGVPLPVSLALATPTTPLLEEEEEVVEEVLGGPVSVPPEARVSICFLASLSITTATHT